MNLNSDHLKSTVSEQIGYESSFVSLFGAFFFFKLLLFTDSMDFLILGKKSAFRRRREMLMCLLLWVRFGLLRSRAFYCCFAASLQFQASVSGGALW